ncbi:MAG: hypothetical protein QM765_26100 [Myxococcales bacterium]
MALLVDWMLSPTTRPPTPFQLRYMRYASRIIGWFEAGRTHR